jgi:DNA-binding PucR family transcriptional regulator
MPYQTKAAEVRLLANRLRWINDQRVISLAQAQEVCRRLGEIISFLDELAEITLETRRDPSEPADVAAGNSELSLHPMSPARVRWEHIHRVYEMCNRNVSETARRLNMHRRTLQRILAKRAPR